MKTLLWIGEIMDLIAFFAFSIVGIWLFFQGEYQAAAIVYFMPGIHICLKKLAGRNLMEEDQ